MISQNIFTFNLKSKKVRYIVTDLFLVTAILLIPSVSHLTAIPFYQFEPMRFALVFCIISTNRVNSLFIALLLPVVSFTISSHPELLKGVIMSFELIVNVTVFYFLVSRLKNSFFIMLYSIMIAKIFYYSGKFLLLSFGLSHGTLVSTPLWIQLALLILISAITAIALRNREKTIRLD